MASDKEFTKPKWHKSSERGADLAYTEDSDNDADADNWGMKAAKTSSSAAFKRGGAVDGSGAKTHMGRAHRARGGKVDVFATDPSKIDTTRLGEYPKLRASGGKVDDREERARGGRAKGNTTVNIIVGAGKSNQPPPAPPPAMPPSPPPPPPQAAHPPMPMPSGGMPPGGPSGMPPGGAPPMPMRARGGKVFNLTKSEGGGGGAGARMAKAAAYGTKLQDHNKG